MQAGKTFGDQLREARMRSLSYNEKLATQAGAAEELGVASPETIGRWERDEASPSNFNIRRMAQLYNAPELMQNYCAMLCPLGKGRMTKYTDESFERTAIRIFNEVQNAGDIARALLMIASDGEVDPEETETFQTVVKKLGGIKAAIEILEVYAEKQGL